MQIRTPNPWFLYNLLAIPFCYRDSPNSKVHDLLVVEEDISMERMIWVANSYCLLLIWISLRVNVDPLSPFVYPRGVEHIFGRNFVLSRQLWIIDLSQFVHILVAEIVFYCVQLLSMVVFHNEMVHVTSVEYFNLRSRQTRQSFCIVVVWDEPMHIYPPNSMSITSVNSCTTLRNCCKFLSSQAWSLLLSIDNCGYPCAFYFRKFESYKLDTTC